MREEGYYIVKKMQYLEEKSLNSTQLSMRFTGLDDFETIDIFISSFLPCLPSVWVFSALFVILILIVQYLYLHHILQLCYFYLNIHFRLNYWYYVVFAHSYFSCCVSPSFEHNVHYNFQVRVRYVQLYQYRGHCVLNMSSLGTLWIFW